MHVASTCLSTTLETAPANEGLFQTSLTFTTGHTNIVFNIKFLPYTADMDCHVLW